MSWSGRTSPSRRAAPWRHRRGRPGASCSRARRAWGRGSPTGPRRMGGGGGGLNVIEMWSLDGSEQVSEDALRHSTRVLELTQTVVRAQRNGSASLWVVTRGAQSTAAGEVISHLGSTPLWGLGKSINREHPDLHCKRVDLDPSAPAHELEQLHAELLGRDGEDEVALRGKTRRVARLARSRRLQLSNDESGPALREDASYVITGGLGGLGPAGAEP